MVKRSEKSGGLKGIGSLGNPSLPSLPSLFGAQYMLCKDSSG
jgi:hypothetical protein